jgi:alkylation response protein AidB-like acyl-CoA dehydrogenase
MFDAVGRRIDEIGFPPDYWSALREGYRRGIVWRVFEQQSLLPFFALCYVTTFFDPGMGCPYTVSLATAMALDKYGTDSVKRRFLDPMLARDGSAWQGGTWMTEIGGGSDLGAGVETVARPIDNDHWQLDGVKYFASNAGAECALVAARVHGAPSGLRGLALFVVPRLRETGALNYTIRRLKDKIATRSVPTGEVELHESEAFLLGEPGDGIHRILEVLNLSRVANAAASVALAQRAIADACAFGRRRIVFGKPVVDHPLMRAEIEAHLRTATLSLALTWEAIVRLDDIWRHERPDPDRYAVFRLLAHLAKYWTAENAVESAKWAIEAHGGVGTLFENRVERWLREAMILAIWEGTRHRQVLDGVEVMERKGAHRLLLSSLGEPADRQTLDAWDRRIADHLAQPPAKKEAGAERLFRDLAVFTAERLANRR